MIIDFSAIGVIKEQPVLILKNADGTPIQTLGYAFHLKADIRYNEVSTITFDLPAYADGEKTPHYDDVIGMRIIDMQGYGQFVLMNPKTTNNGVREVKSCKAYSLEYELTYKTMYIPPMDNQPINLRGVADMILEDAPSWDIILPDDLLGKYRTLSEENTNVYNFIKSTVQKTFGCIFDFNTYERKMTVRSVDAATVTEPVHISLDNLAKQIDIEEDTEHIVTVLDVNGGENVDILMVNPLGTNKLYNLDYFMNETHFSGELIRKWNAWKQKLENCRHTYYNTSIRLALKTSEILTEEARKREIEGTELGTLENERAVYIELMAQLSDKSSAEYRAAASKLNTVNQKIENKQVLIAHEAEVIETLYAEKDAILDELSAIKNQVSFDNTDNFNADDLAALRRYFKEDSIEESSFVLSDVESYDDSSAGGAIERAVVLFSGGTVSRTTDASGRYLYTVTGGTMSCTLNGSETLSASVVTANIERAASGNGTCTISAYLGNGIIGDASFPSASVSFVGMTSVVATEYDTGRVAYTRFTIYNQNRFYFTRNTTDYERYVVEWSLYDYGCECLNALAYPSYTFNVSLANFFAIEDFRSFTNAIRLGERVYLNTGDKILEPICIGASIDFENMTNLTLLFGDKYSASDNSFKLVDLLDNSISMGKTLNSNKLSYSSFINSGASTSVKSFMQSALDVAKNKVLSSTGQGISWDETGLHLRKYKENPEDGFENEQIWATNNAIVFTDDGWQSAKMAIGKIVDESIKKYVATTDTVFNPTKTYYKRTSSNGYYLYERWNGGASGWNSRPALYELNDSDHTGYGIAAPYIIGTLLAGQNLEIATENGSFRVDGSGVWIDSLNFHITHGSQNNKTLNEAFTSVQQDTANLSAHVDEVESDLTSQINATTKTYYQDSPPENPNVGDLWFNTYEERRTIDGTPYLPKKLYRYTEDVEEVYDFETGDVIGTGPWLHWVVVEDAGVQNALNAAATAQTTADSKVQVYFQYNLPSGSWSTQERIKHIGDLWYHPGLMELLYFDNASYYLGYRGWRKLEDGDAKYALSLSRSNQSKLANVIKENGCLDSEKLDGVISAQVNNMKNGTGNVLFDGDGLWLMNNASKELATQAVWINENGIMIGSGDPGDPKEWVDGDGNSAWKTAISYNGIIANALASKSLSSQEIYGLEIKIGGTAENPNFRVDTDGNLYAGNGTFKGTLDSPTLNGKLTTNGSAWLIGAGLSVGGNPSESGGNFYVDTNGNVTMKGSLNLSEISSINWGSHTPNDCEFSQNGSSGWHKDMRVTDYYRRDWNHATNQYGDAYQFRGRDGQNGESPDLPNYIQSTYIDFTRVNSPHINGTDIGLYGGDFRVYDTSGTDSYGFIGHATGKGVKDNEPFTTHGVALAAGSTPTSNIDYTTVGNYIIATGSGIRLHSGTNINLYLTPDGAYYDDGDDWMKICTAKFAASYGDDPPTGSGSEGQIYFEY